MKGIFRRLRGIIGTGVIWAVGWAGGLVAWHIIGGWPLEFIGQTVFTGLVLGFVAGGSFASVLSIAERRHTLADLSLWRAALWGGIGGTLLIIVAVSIAALVGASIGGGVLGGLAWFFLLGAGCASGSVALAKRADRILLEGDEQQLLPSKDG